MTTMQLTGSFSTTERSEAAEHSKVSSDADYELETAFSELVDE